MANITTSGNAKPSIEAFMREHREAWLEYYITRMAKGDVVPVVNGPEEFGDLIGVHRQYAHDLEKKLKKRCNIDGNANIKTI